MIITRFHDVEKLDVLVEFLTPTFLGGADQNAELRSAPFKNLIRQWWRVVNGNLNADDLRRQEDEIFGTVLGDDKTTASKVRIAVVQGAEFRILNDHLRFGETKHPEVKGCIENSLYLGYGPVSPKKEKHRKYIAPESIIALTISFPPQLREQIVRTLQMIDAFGTIGSRCRNGYGSLALTTDGVARLNPATIQCAQLPELVGNNRKEYPNQFGRDNKGMFLWETSPQAQWTNAMKVLAETYLKTRTAIQINKPGLQPRHALGYPVTNHPVDDWDVQNRRMPSQLRLMVKRNQANELVGRILHLPHNLAKPWSVNILSQLDVWQKVHQFLDLQDQFHRIGGGA